jgi:hypothetical protein
MLAQLSNDERQLLSTLPQTIGSAMAFAGHSGIFGTGKEMFASAQGMMAGSKDFPNNELIKAIVPNLASGDRNAEIARAKESRDWAMARMKSKGIDNPEKFSTQALEDVRAAAALLGSKASPQEASEYKQWVMKLAEGVANAATEGGFLGFGGERLSEGERKLLGEIKSALGVA